MADVVEFGAVERRHVDREPHLPALEIIDDQARGLNGDGHLRFLGRSAQVRRDNDFGMRDQGVVRRRRFGIEDVDRRARDLARVQGGQKRGFVDQAASAQLTSRTPVLILASACALTTLRVSADIGVCKVM